MEHCLRRWQTTGLLGLALLQLFGSSIPALALPQPQIIQKLQPVVVFTVVNESGAPLLSTDAAGGPPSLGVFLTPKDAETFIASFKSQEDIRASQLRVQTISLAQLYQMQTASRGRTNEMKLTFFPERDQVSWAQTTLLMTGRRLDELKGTPLFAAVISRGRQYLTLKIDGKHLIPLYFTKADIQAFVERYRRQANDPKAEVEIRFFSLEEVLEAFQKSNDPLTERFILMPSKVVIEYVRSQSPPANPAQPAQPNSPTRAVPAVPASPSASSPQPKTEGLAPRPDP